jgi:hypothetical protein
MEVSRNMEASRNEIYSVIGKPLNSKIRITFIFIIVFILFIIIIVFLIVTQYIKIEDPIKNV